jgi:ribosomal 50S subunit-recycling heat shock protein
MKGKERFEIDRDSNTKVTGDLKVGDKVTVQYTMSAKEVEVKADKNAKKDAKASTSPAAAPKK